MHKKVVHFTTGEFGNKLLCEHFLCEHIFVHKFNVHIKLHRKAIACSQLLTIILSACPDSYRDVEGGFLLAPVSTS